MPGIEKENIVVNLDRDAFTVGYDASLVSLESMYEVIIELGYAPGLRAPEVEEVSAPGEAATSAIDSALKAVSRTGQLILIKFSAEWCAACKVLEAQVFSHASVRAALQDYIFIEVDTDSDPDSAESYNVLGMPTLVIVNAEGQELYRKVGLIAPAEFSQILNDLATP